MKSLKQQHVNLSQQGPVIPKHTQQSLRFQEEHIQVQTTSHWTGCGGLWSPTSGQAVEGCGVLQVDSVFHKTEQSRPQLTWWNHTIPLGNKEGGACKGHSPVSGNVVWIQLIIWSHCQGRTHRDAFIMSFSSSLSLYYLPLHTRTPVYTPARVHTYTTHIQ